ncbi:MAG: hypothetical protein WAW99_03390 [Candidatus Bipolaricaulis anaerobius]
MRCSATEGEEVVYSTERVSDVARVLAEMGYELDPAALNLAQKFAQQGGGKFEVTTELDDAVKGATVVFPRGWMSPPLRDRQRGGDQERGEVQGLEVHP